jgi:hypothetical protein
MQDLAKAGIKQKCYRDVIEAIGNPEITIEKIKAQVFFVIGRD